MLEHACVCQPAGPPEPPAALPSPDLLCGWEWGDSEMLWQQGRGEKGSGATMLVKQSPLSPSTVAARGWQSPGTRHQRRDVQTKLPLPESTS